MLPRISRKLYTLSVLFFLHCSCFVALNAQDKAYLKGTVSDETGSPLFTASVGIDGKSIGTVTNQLGKFELEIPANENLKLIVYYLGYESYETLVTLKPDEIKQLTIQLRSDVKQLEDVEVIGINKRENTLVPINLHSINQLPNSSGNIETIIKTLPGVTSGNELSSQYSVRGGSFDENLIYVNDIEVHRPLLIQSAQQEGLSFVNPDLVSSIQFSAGGFDAEYGDKLSSVLDIRYKKPSEFGGSVSASLLGGSAHVEGASKNNRLNFISGFRYKTTRFLLQSLDTKGDYNPAFGDLQTFITYDITPKLELNILGNYSQNNFSRKPTRRITDFGSLQQTYSFDVYYEGGEEDRFDTYLGAASLIYKPTENLNLKLIGSAFNSNETITYDLLQQYWIGQAQESSSGARDSLVNIGVGTSLEHARDYLQSNLFSLKHVGSYFTESGVIKWGLKAQREYISDEINEWEMLDSAGFSIPYSDEELLLTDVYKASNTLLSTRTSGFAQYSHTAQTNAGELRFTLGMRSQYWTFNEELTVSPRGNISYTPASKSHVTFHLATGLYHQPPFYKEIRDKEGNLYRHKEAQRSIHYVAGIDYNFLAWKRPFVFTGELYYKHITNVIPYKMDDVRLEYLPMFNARAYATGIDLRVYGEFVPGNESWFSLSLLRTREDIYNDYIQNLDGTVEYPGYYRRPTDQWLNFSVFFQDYLPSNPNYKVHLLVNYGSGLSFSGPRSDRPSEVNELGNYRRVDIGFSRLIVRNKGEGFGVKSIWISAEVLNLIDAPNKVSLEWIRTIQSQFGYNVYFAVPNYLTGRIFNLKLSVNL